MTNKIEQARLLSAKELAAALSLSRRQIHRLNACGRIPKPAHIGGSLRFVSSEISAWILSGCPDRKTWEQMKEAEQC